MRHLRLLLTYICWLKFVNIAANQNLRANHDLEVGTTTPTVVLCTSEIDQRRVVLIDTPPYPNEDGRDSADEIQRWIEKK